MDNLGQQYGELCAKLDYFCATLDDYGTNQLSAAIGIVPNESRLFIIWLLQYGLGWFFFYFVRGTTLRHFYNIFFGFVIQLYYFKQDIYHVWFLTLGAYLLMIVLPRKSQAKFVFLFCMAHLSWNQICRMLYKDLMDLDIVIYTMVHVCRLTALAFHYQNGILPKEELEKKQYKHLTVYEKPTLLEMSSFTLVCTSCATSLFFEFADWKHFIEYTHEYELKPNKKSLPSPVIPSLKTLALGLACSVIFLVLHAYFPVEYCFTTSFNEGHNLGYRLYYTYFTLMGRRFFLHTPFTIGTGCLQACGFGFDGYDQNGEAKWHKVNGAEVIKMETAESTNLALKYWNHQTHVWLKTCILEEVSPLVVEKMANRLLFTFLVSGFWHGFWPSYYVFFFFIHFVNEACKSIYKVKHKFWWIPKPFGYLICWQCSIYSVSYLGVCFHAYTWSRCAIYLKGTYCFGIIVTFIVLGIGKAMADPKPKKVKTDETPSKSFKKTN